MIRENRRHISTWLLLAVLLFIVVGSKNPSWFSWL